MPTYPSRRHARPLPNSFRSLAHGANDENQCALRGVDGPGQTEGSIIGSQPHSPSITPATSYDASSSQRFDPTLKEADDCLKTFRNEISKYFSFLILPASISAQLLRIERPFLWLCIMAISSKSSKQQMELGLEIRLTLGRKLLVEGEKSLDLLLDILTYTA